LVRGNAGHAVSAAIHIVAKNRDILIICLQPFFVFRLTVALLVTVVLFLKRFYDRRNEPRNRNRLTKSAEC